MSMPLLSQKGLCLFQGIRYKKLMDELHIATSLIISVKFSTVVCIVRPLLYPHLHDLPKVYTSHKVFTLYRDVCTLSQAQAVLLMGLWWMYQQGVHLFEMDRILNFSQAPVLQFLLWRYMHCIKHMRL